MEDRLFGLDVQLLFDAFVLFVVIMIMYAIMSRLFFKPVRAFLEQRKQAVAADRDEAQQLQEAAEVSKAAYEEKLKAVHKEAEEILSASRKAAMKQQDAIIDQAKSEASAIMEQASGCEKRDVRTGTCNDRAVCRSCGSTAWRSPS